MKLQSGFKKIFWLILASSFGTGATWFLLHTFGPKHSPAEYWLIRAHVTSDYLLMLTLGYLVRVHVQPGLKNKRHRRSGLVMIATFIVMMVSSLFILYAEEGSLHHYSTRVHSYLGLSIPILLGIHLIQKRWSGSET